MRYNCITTILFTILISPGCGGSTPAPQTVPTPATTDNTTPAPSNASPTTGSSAAGAGASTPGSGTTTGAPEGTTTGGTGAGGTTTGGGFATVQVDEGNTNSLQTYEGLNASGAAGTPATVTGDLFTVALKPLYAWFDYYKDANGNPVLLEVDLSDKADYCQAVQNSNLVENSTFILLRIGDFSPTGDYVSLIQNETFTVQDSNFLTAQFATAYFLDINNQCKEVPISGITTGSTAPQVASGTVTVTQFEPTSLQGQMSFKTGPSNSPFTASFTAMPCHGLLDLGLGAAVVIGCQP